MLHLLVRSMLASAVHVCILIFWLSIMMDTFSFESSATSSSGLTSPIPSTAKSSTSRYFFTSDQMTLSNSPCSGQVFFA